MGARIKGIEPTLKEHLLLHDWPGNAREVRNLMEHALGVEKEGLISWPHLSDLLVGTYFAYLTEVVFMLSPTCF